MLNTPVERQGSGGGDGDLIPGINAPTYTIRTSQYNACWGISRVYAAVRVSSLIDRPIVGRIATGKATYVA